MSMTNKQTDRETETYTFGNKLE